MPRKISHQQLIDDLYNLDISDEQLAEYLQEKTDASTPFAPIIEANPDMVTPDGTEGDIALGALNGIAKWRRKKLYKRRIKDWNGIRIVSEGDSWFQYPFLLKDVIDHLSDLNKYQYAIYSLGEAGDLLNDIIRKDEITEALERENPHVLLISGGGNDMVGGSRMERMVHSPSDDITEPQGYLNAEFTRFLEKISTLYNELFTRLLREFPHLKIVCHGYDYAIPDSGKWLGDPLAKAGIDNRRTQKAIVKVMIDRLNVQMEAVAQQFSGSVFCVDARKTVPAHDGWHDELHPNSEAYGLVAVLFDRAIQKALAGESAPVLLGSGTVADGSGHLSTVPKVNQLGKAEFDRLVYTRAKEVIGEKVTMPQSRHERRQLEQDLADHFEKIHKQADFLPASFLERGVDRAHSVCRIVTDLSYGSGFMVVNRNYIMTNNHVLPNRDVAQGSSAQFDYDHDNEEFHVALDPEKLFITDQNLDYTIVALASHSLPEVIQPITLLENPATVTRNERVNVIQHPQGRRKEVSIHDNKVTYVYDKIIRYTADTEPGSSGSPVLNNQWQLVALHHAGWIEDDGSASNEGIRIAAIVENLKNRGSDQSKQICSLIEQAITSEVGEDTAQGASTSRRSMVPLSRGSDSNQVLISVPEKFGTLQISFET